MKRSNEQLQSMEKLRNLLAEKGFRIYTLKGRKHPDEFLAVRESGQLSALICRFWRDTHIRLLALERPKGTLQRQETQELTAWVGSILRFLPYPLNPTRYGNNRIWDEYTLKRELATSV